MLDRPGKAVAIAAAAVCAGLIGAAGAFAAVSGDLDHGFDGDGKLVTDFGGTPASVFDAELDSSGRLVVAGQNGAEIGVARFNPDGSFDPTFGGGDGQVQVHTGNHGGGEFAEAVSIDPATGNIVLFGDANGPAVGENQDLTLVRLEPDGDLDPTFDGPGGSGNGMFRLNFGTTENAEDVVVNGGKIDLVLGLGSPTVTRVAQLESNGALDTDEFGSPNGYLDFQFQSGTGSFANSIIVEGDGKLLIGGVPNSGATTYGVARLNSTGSLDASFNSAGTTPGIARPALPSAAYRKATALDLLVDGSGIVVAGSVEEIATSDDDPMLSRLTSNGTLDSSFGTNGYAILPAGPQDDAFRSVEPASGGELLASGFFNTGSDLDQLLARFSGTGTLDTSFSAPDGFLTIDLGIPSSGLAGPLSSGGTAYVVGQGNDGGARKMAISAVCVDAATACPAPEMPVVDSVTPASGSNDNSPRIGGEVPAGEAPTSVEIFTSADCSDVPAATGSEAEFEGEGIPVSVPDNKTTTFFALARGVHADSPCSTTSVTYTEVTPDPTPGPQPPGSGPSGPTGLRAKALKKCAKVKKMAKRKKCKKRARKLPV